MEDIVHYKHVDEKYYTYKLVEVKESECDLLPFDDSEVKVKEGKPQQCWLPIDQIEFKKTMSENKDVSTDRSTYVVSEDLTKNTVSLKVFIMAKRTVPVKNLARRKFKITQHEQFSLTINKTTGDFSIYKKTYNKRKYYYTIRKNIITEQIKDLITRFFMVNNNSIKAAEKLYELLGYKPLMRYKDFFNEYLPPLSQDYYDPRLTSSLPSFPFLNYLFKSGIEDLSYENLHMFEYIYKRDKKHFHNRSVYDYIKYHYDIKDNDLFMFVKDELTLCTIKAFDNHHAEYKKTESKHSYRFNLPGIHVGLLEFIKRYNIPASKYKQLGLITPNYYHDFTREYGYDKVPMFVHRMIDYYGFNITEVLNYQIENYNNCLNAFKAMSYFEMFGVKMKITRPAECWDKHDDYQRIYDALCVARGDTGTFKLNNSFVVGLRKLLPEGYDLLISQSGRPRKSTNTHWLLYPNTKTYEKVYDLNSPSALFAIKDDQNRIIFKFWTSGIEWGIKQTPMHPGLEQIENSDTIKKIKAFMANEMDNNRVFLNQIYSKAYFEKYLFDTFRLKAKDFLVYTN